MSYGASVLSNTTIVPVLEDDKNIYISELILPIIIQGEKEGVIVLCEAKNKIEFDESHLLVLKLISKFLSLQLE